MIGLPWQINCVIIKVYVELRVYTRKMGRLEQECKKRECVLRFRGFHHTVTKTKLMMMTWFDCLSELSAQLTEE